MNENYSNQLPDEGNAYYTNEPMKPERTGSQGLAIASLVLGILSLLCCFCGLGIIAAPIGIILGIIVIAGKKNGLGMAVAGIIMSAITVLAMVYSYYVAGDYVKDYIKFANNYNEVVEEYEESGELPEYLEKYRGEDYEEFWEQSGYGDFDGFFQDIISQMDAGGMRGND